MFFIDEAFGRKELTDLFDGFSILFNRHEDILVIVYIFFEYSHVSFFFACFRSNQHLLNAPELKISLDRYAIFGHTLLILGQPLWILVLTSI